MTTYQKNKLAPITEEEVMFYDIDPVLYGDKARVQPCPSAEWIYFDAFEFFHWLVDTNRLEYFAEDDETVYRAGCCSSVDSFWRELAISREADRLLNEYLTAEELAQNQAA